MNMAHAVREITSLLAQAGHEDAEIVQFGTLSADYGFRVIIHGVQSADEMRAIIEKNLAPHNYALQDADVCDGAALGYADILAPQPTLLDLAA